MGVESGSVALQREEEPTNQYETEAGGVLARGKGRKSSASLVRGFG